jgi:hypothetical protein
LNSSTDRTFHNDPNKSETRGRKRKWTEDDIDAVEDLFEKEGFEGERLQPSEIPAAAGVPDVHPSTTRRSLRIRKYNKRLAHIVEFIDERYAKRRKKWSEDITYISETLGTIHRRLIINLPPNVTGWSREYR